MNANSVAAEAIFEELKGLRNCEFLRKYEPKNISAVKHGLYARFRREGLDYKIIVREDALWIRSKPQSRQQRLEAMIRKLAMHVEDEKLYEEALALVDYI